MPSVALCSRMFHTPRLRFSLFLVLLFCLLMPALSGAQVTFIGGQNSAGSINFGTQAINSTSSAQALNFSVASGTAVGSIAVMTSGSPNLDFANAGGSGSCTPITYSSATNCVINATFKPRFAGMRSGAVVFFSGVNNTGTVLASVPMYGVGTGPQTAFNRTPITQFTATVDGYEFYGPGGVAVDGAGDLFVTDNNEFTNRLVEFPAGGGAATAIPLPGVTASPQGIAIDGAGDLFIAEFNLNQVVELPAGGGTPVVISPTVNGIPMGHLEDVVVDGSGDLFISDPYNGRVVEVPATGSPAFEVNTTIDGNPAGLGFPAQTAVDAAGDLFIVDSTEQRVVEVPAGGGTPFVINISVDGYPGLSEPDGIAVDAAGDLFISNIAKVVEVPPGGGAATILQTIGNGSVYFGHMTLDGAGDLFVANPNYDWVEELHRSELPNLNFPTLTVVNTTDTADGTQTVAVQNIGNQPLNFTALSYPVDFSATSDANACTGSTTLISTQVCDLPIEFTPLNIGSPLTEYVTLTDNTLNVPGTAQAITASGSASEPVTVTVGNSPAGSQFIGEVLQVDNTQFSGAQTFTWAVGSTHTLLAVGDFESADGGTIYTFSNWSPGATSANETVTAAEGVTSYTANYVVYSYLLTDSVNNSAQGSVTPASGGYYVAGAPTSITATANAGYYFAGWTGSADIASASSASTTITMNGPETITANFAPLPVLVVTTANDDVANAANCTQQAAPGTGTDHACSLRDALTFVQNSGATSASISFDSTVFAATNTVAENTITLSNGTLNIPSNISIFGATTGSGPTLTNLVTVNGKGASTVFTVASGVTGASIAGLTITNGNSSSGGGISNSGTLTVSSSTISGNAVGGSGGGVYNTGTLTLSGSTLSGNSAHGSFGGGVGGGIYNSGTLNVSNCTITGNSATGEASGAGGGIDNNGGTVTLGSSTLYANSSDGAGGGIFFSGGSAILAYNIVSGNSSSSGADVSGSFTNDGGNQIGASGINLAPLANNGGPTQTLLPLPGSPAICGAQLGDGTLVPNLSIDQRGDPLNSLCGGSFVIDAGAVQTSYVLGFSTEPPSGATVGAALSLNPVVTLTESASVATAASSLVSVAGTPIALSGTTAANLASGLATFSNLVIPAATSSETLTATLALTPSINLTAGSTAIAATNPLPGSFQITTTANPINNNVAIAIKVTALLAGGSADPYYNGMVSFISSDPGFVNPGPLTLTNGVGQTNVTFETLGTQTITATDTVTSSETGNGSFNVSAAPTAGFHIAVPGSAAVGAPFQFTVSAYDVHGNPAIGYTGTVAFTSSDLKATLPSPTTLTNGTGTFNATLLTLGTQTITATDSANILSIQSDNIAVTIANLVVNTNTDDPGTATNCTPQLTATSNTTNSACSLRDALLLAADLGIANIGFDSTVFAASNSTALNTIQISNGILNIPSNTAIIGPTTGSGATLAQIVTVNANETTLIFNVNSGVTNASIGGLSVANGSNQFTNYGGDIYNNGGLTITNCSITGGSATYGGGIENDGTLAIIGSTIYGNNAFSGGGILNQGTLTATNSTVAGNTTGTGGRDGGGIASFSGTVTLINSTVSGNYAGTYAGAISTFSTQLTLTNSTIYGNTAGSNLGGISLNGGSTTLANSTIANNPNGGFSAYSVALTMSNNVISGNEPDFTNSNNTSTITDNGGNVIGGATLSPLANYGGPTQTAIPLPGNGALCGGTFVNATAARITADQRGFPFDPLCPSGFVDSGAVQTSFAMAFSTQPPTAVGSQPMSPAPVVELTERGVAAPGAASPVSMSDHAGFVDGTTSVNFVADLATFSNLDFSASSASDKLVATLPLNSTQNLTATSNSFSVASPVVSRFTVTTTVNPIYGNVSYTITVTAVYPGGTTATGYNGTVSFTSSDSGFVNPGHLTLTNGVGHAIVTLATFGTQTITATDTVTSALTGSGSFMVVFPTAGLRITVPASAVVGTPFNFTVTAVDTQGHQATAYTGTVTLTSSDSYATLPSPATLTNGIGTFSATLATPGTQTITATDAVNRFAVTSSSIAVTAPNLVVNTAADGPGATQVCTAQAAPGSNTTDSGCSLRDALATATSLGGGAVSFDSTVFARSKGTAADTILLIEGPLYIPTNTSVTGPGGTMAQIVTVSGNAQSTVFVISNGVANTSISGLTITNGNFAPATGGDIDNDGELTVTNSVVSGATANAGGGIYNTGTLVLTGVTISGNTAFYGGGIYNSGSLTVTQSTILNNTTGTGGSGGGGISSYGGTVTLISSTVSGNYAGGDGGGIANYGTLTLINSTLYGNSTGASIAGAFTVSGSTTTENSTIANNAGIGLDIFDSSMTMSNTIISGNTGDFQNQGATVTDKGGNLIGGVTLTPLGNYGGPTQTAVPLPGSTAICGGTRANATAASLTTDQRGFGFISTYCPTGFVDAGAVQTNYSMAFTTEPPASGFPDVKLTRAPAVQLKESGFIATAATNPLSMSGSPVTLSRTTSANLSGGSATFSNLAVSAVTSSETLTATLALTSSVNLTAASTPNTIDVGKLTPTVSLNAISSPLTLGPSTSLTAVFTTVSGAPAPTQQMKFYAGSTLLGSATLTTSSSTTYRATLSSAEIPLGSETIVATYPGDSSYVTASSSGQTINVVSKILWIGNPAGTTSAFVDNGTPYLSSAESHGGKGIAIDSSGNVWSLNATGNSVAEFTSSGTVTSAGHTGGGLSAPTSLAIDGSGNVWITNSGGSISVFKSAGTAVSATAYTGGELNSPTSIAVDISGNLWIANHGSKSVTKVLGAAAPTVPLAKGVVNGTAATKP